MVKDNPMDQYAIWFQEALSSDILDPYAACLSTVDLDGQPSSRMVYIRDILEEGFVFYTNYNSSKGKNLFNNSGALSIGHEIFKNSLIIFTFFLSDANLGSL